MITPSGKIAGQPLTNQLTKEGFMSTTLRKYGAKYNTTFCQFCGLSTDTKPTISFDGVYIANGSEFVEIDTDTKYLYDAEHQQWIER